MKKRKKKKKKERKKKKRKEKTREKKKKNSSFFFSPQIQHNNKKGTTCIPSWRSWTGTFLWLSCGNQWRSFSKFNIFFFLIERCFVSLVNPSYNNNDLNYLIPFRLANFFSTSLSFPLVSASSTSHFVSSVYFSEWKLGFFP